MQVGTVYVGMMSEPGVGTFWLESCDCPKWMGHLRELGRADLEVDHPKWSWDNAGSWDGYNCWDDVDLQESGVGTYNCPKS